MPNLKVNFQRISIQPFDKSVIKTDIKQKNMRNKTKIPIPYTKLNFNYTNYIIKFFLLMEYYFNNDKVTIEYKELLSLFKKHLLSNCSMNDVVFFLEGLKKNNVSIIIFTFTKIAGNLIKNNYTITQAYRGDIYKFYYYDLDKNLKFFEFLKTDIIEKKLLNLQIISAKIILKNVKKQYKKIINTKTRKEKIKEHLNEKNLTTSTKEIIMQIYTQQMEIEEYNIFEMNFF